MRKILFLIPTLLIISFHHLSAQQNSNADVVKEFLTDVLVIDSEKLNSHSPIGGVSEIASTKASKTIQLSKENISEALKEGKNYKSCIIIVGNHTIVKVTDFSKTVSSGSWSCQMPYGEGYVLKGTLVHMTDYINNIIGKPDEQIRTMYLFN